MSAIHREMETWGHRDYVFMCDICSLCIHIQCIYIVMTTIMVYVAIFPYMYLVQPFLQTYIFLNIACINESIRSNYIFYAVLVEQQSIEIDLFQ